MSIVQLVRNAVREFIEDECSSLAAVIAYSAFFSLFPLMLAAVALVGFVIDSPDAQQRIINAVVTNLPGSADFVQSTLQGVIKNRGSTGLISAVLLLISGRAVFESTIRAIDKVFETPSERGFVGSLLLAFGLMFGVGSILILSLGVTTVMQVIGSLNVPVFGLGPIGQSPLWPVVTTLVGLFINFLMFLLLYRLAPNVQLTWRDVAPGAAVAAVLFEIAKWGFVIYLSSFTNYDAVYGTIGAVIALLTWCYFSALIMLFGAEVASEYMKLRRANVPAVARPGPVIATPAHATPTRRAIAVAGTGVAIVLAFVATVLTRRSSAAG